MRLFRIPNVFTAMADVAMGFLFVHQSLQPVVVFVLLLIASSLLYTAGMVLNDVYDIEVDARERPNRPLPSGQIPVGWAKWLGYELLLVGAAAGWLAGYILPVEAAAAWRSGAVATALAVAIVLYDAVLKKTLVGPLAMGACRFLNVLLGMSVAPLVAAGNSATLGYDVTQLLVAGGIGVYIVGVTWFARTEATASSRRQLISAVAVMMAGVGMLALFPWVGGNAPRLMLRPPMIWPLMLLLLVATIFRRCYSAILDPAPQLVQAAVKHCILSLIILDAAVTLAVTRPSEPFWALGVLALLLPTLLLGKWVYST